MKKQERVTSSVVTVLTMLISSQWLTLRVHVNELAVFHDHSTLRS